MKDITKELIGKTEQEAMDLLKVEGLRCRIEHRDGKNFILTMDAMSNRYNLSVKDGKVFKARIG